MRPSGLSPLNEYWIPERGARMARRDDREYREYLREEQRRQPGCPARKPVLDQRRQATSRKHLAPASALAGAGLLAWLIARVGPAGLFELWDTVRPILPIIAALTGLRYVLQAAGWRLATRATERPGWGPTLAGVVAGEAAGYVAGMLAREPIKLLFVRDRVPTRVALSGAAVERLATVSAGAALILTTLTMVALGRAPRLLPWGLGAVLVMSIAWMWKRRFWNLLGLRGVGEPARSSW